MSNKFYFSAQTKISGKLVKAIISFGDTNFFTAMKGRQPDPLKSIIKVLKRYLDGSYGK